MTGLDPVAVNARMWFDDEDECVDKQAAINITFENGAVASIGVSGDSPLVREHHHIWGDDGAIYIDGENWDERELEYIDDENNRFVPKLDRWNSGNKAEVFVDLVRNGGTPPATARDGLLVTAVTEAAYESARDGGTVEIDLESVHESIEHAPGN